MVSKRTASAEKGGAGANQTLKRGAVSLYAQSSLRSLSLFLPITFFESGLPITFFESGSRERGEEERK